MATLAQSSLPRPPTDPFRAPPRSGLVPGLGPALAAHAVLLTLLSWGVAWHTAEPAGVSAELWAAVPEVAAARGGDRVAPVPTPPAPRPAPRAPAPPAPAPRAADIAEERAPPPRRPPPDPAPAPQPPRAATPPQKTPQELRREEQVKAAELAAQRQENLARLMKEAGGDAPAPTGGAAARDAGPSATYAGLIKGRIKPNIVFPDALPGNPLAEVEVRAAPDGSILSRRLVRTSGSTAWDEAVLRAIDKTVTLPRDTDGRVPSPLLISFRPND